MSFIKSFNVLRSQRRPQFQRWTFGCDIGIIRTEGVGGSTPDAAIEIGATSLKGSIQDGTRDTFEFNATLDFGTGLSVDVPFDTEAAAKEFQDLIENGSVEQILNYLNPGNLVSRPDTAGFDIAIVGSLVPGPSAAIMRTKSSGVSLTGVHRSGETETWNEIMANLIVSAREKFK